MRLWIDTDVGTDVDDALTLAYALRHPGFDLVGVSTVFGDVELRTRITHALFDAAGVRDIPVVTGLGVPLSDHRHGLMFGHEGRGILADAAPRKRIDEEPDADAKLHALARGLEAARPDVLLAIGPLGNVGALAAAGVPLPRLAIMGGKFEDVMLEGMTPHVSEWNWFCDPLAVQHVLDASHAVLPRVVPAEVTFRTELADGDVERLAEGDDLARALASLSREWLDFQASRGSPRPRVMLHDPLTLATLVEPGLCAFANRRVRVDDQGASETLAGEPNVEVAVDVDAAAVRAHLMDAWL